MNKKRLRMLMAAMLLGICCIMILIACNKIGGDPSDTGTGTNAVTDAPEPTNVSLLENGAFVYRIIRGETGKDNSGTAAVNLKKALQTVTGAEIEVRTDFEDKDSNDDIKEILIGTTNRQASVDAMNGLKTNEYIIRVVGSKIVITGGSSEMLSMAIKQFLLNCVGYVSDSDYTAKTEITVKGNFELCGSVKEADKDIVVLQTKDSISYMDRLIAELESFHPKDKIRIATLKNDMSQVFNTQTTGLVIITGADTVTGQARYALDQYLKNSGRVLMLGGPAFETVLYLSGGELLSLSDYLQAEYDKLTESSKQTVFDTSDETVHRNFVRNRNSGSGVNNWDGGGWFSYGDYGLGTESTVQMQVRMTGLNSAGWAFDAFRSDFTPDDAIRSKMNAIGFWARSDEAEPTTGVVLEIVDSQGVAWYANVELTTEWRYYVFCADDFLYYENRGNETTAAHPIFAGMKTVGFGIDNQATHFPQTAGNHAFYLSGIEALVLDSTVLNNISEVQIDGVAPYDMVQYPITNGASIGTYENQIFLSERDYVLAEELISCSPGSQGTGYNKNRYYRFIPLLEVKDSGGYHSGYAAWINLYARTGSATSREGAIVGYFSSCSEDFYDVNGILAVGDVAQAMTGNVFLVEGGSDEYTYIPTDISEIAIGGTYVDLSKYKDSQIGLTIDLYDGATLVASYASANLKPQTLSNNTVSYKSTFSIAEKRPDRVVTTLIADGKTVDRIEQTIGYWEAKPESERSYVYVEDGYFKRDGKIINLIGVNYWPSYHLALQNYNGEFDVRAKYDPDVVRADLARIKELGMTSVALSLFATNVTKSNNMLDLVRICEEMGLYVDLAIRSRDDYNSDFLYFSKEDADDLVLRLHFNENDNIVAYDMCWERRIGTYEGDVFGIGRKRYDAEWEKWIISQYGSVSQAEKLWGTSAPRDSDGNVIGMSDAMLNSGGASAMINAYYRFLDDIVAKEFNEFRQYLLTLDSNHLLSFRMQNAGSAVNPSEGNYDFQSLASVMDFMSPEGYSISSGEDSMIQLMFLAAYARYCAPDSPVLMKEFTTNLLTGSNFDPKNNAVALEKAAYLREFMEYAYTSEFSAFYFWWYVSGIRSGEETDCGLFALDGSDRLTTEVFREWIPKFTERGERTRECVTVEIERDDTGLGIKGMFEKVKDQLLAAYRDGKNVVFVNKHQTGANEVFYADEVLDEAVGGTKTSGSYPFLYVNGQILKVEIYRENGLRYAKITLCNTGHATWRAGTVSVITTESSEVFITPAAIEEDVGYLEEIEIVVMLKRMGNLELRFEIDGMEFGMVYESSL